MKLSKRRNVILNILVSLADSLVISYVLMFLTWLVRGMRVGLEGCVRIWAVYYILCAGIMIIISFGLAALRRGELRDITDRMFDKGCDDEYFRLLKEYMGGELLPSQQLVFASCYLEAGRMEDCRRELEKVDFAALSAPEQEEYFNVCLYSAVLEENVELANEIYRKAKHYLDRAVMKKRGSYVMHTLGMLCYINGRLENAYSLFEAAGKDRSDGLKCECTIGRGLIYLAGGDKEGAKEMCYAAAELAQTYMQAARLKDLMMKVENAYRAEGRKKAGA